MPLHSKRLLYIPSDYFLLNYSSSYSLSDADGRTWDGDGHSKFSPSNISNTSSKSTASGQNLPVNLVPYMFARIFRSQFTYTFPVSIGPKFIRLYFFPANYSDLDIANSFFSVTSSGHTLLSNFSAFLTVSAMKPAVATLRKEFIVNVRDNQRLNITFLPSVLETLYRLNVGGNDVSVTNDTRMFRLWRPDDNYTYAAYGFTPYSDVAIRYTQETPPYTAPKIVCTSSRTMGNQSLKYNLTWRFLVDSGFYYLLRLHF
ncbi:unnamed protein product [Ilex paraguariensis]|uniref:Malectin-like domain-containing protein n=1 Tax=Ilex paraguariensis TaxID=185542 RepID=A0ABC8R7Z3_9AQUA